MRIDRERVKPVAVALLIALPAIALWPVTSAQFTTWDDLATVAQNPHIEAVSVAGVWYYWRHAAMDLYIPLTYTVWGLLAWLPQGAANLTSSGNSALSPALFHSANLALHLVSGLVVFGILRRLSPRSIPAWFGAMLFLLHPVQVEAVAWVSGLKDVLSGMFVLVALYAYIRDLKASEAAWRRWYFIATAAFALALLAKPSAMIAPVLVVILEVTAFRRPLRTALRRVAPWLVLSIACGIVAATVQPASHLVDVPLWQRPFVAADALAFQIRQVLFPMQLTVDHGRTPQVVMGHWSGYVTWLIPATCAVLLWMIRKSASAAVTGGLLFVAAILPVLGIVPFDFQKYSTVADHYLYVAMLGPAVMLGAAPVTASRWMTSATCAGLLLLGMKTHAQAWNWQDGQTLYAHMIAVNPRSALAHNNLGYEFVADGSIAAAIPHYQEAIRLDPAYKEAHNNLAWTRDKVDDRPAAIRGYREALSIDASYLDARKNLAAALAADDQLDASLAEMRLVLRADPQSAVWHANTGAVLARLGRLPEAVREYEAALRLDPGLIKAQQALQMIRDAIAKSR